MSETVRAQSLNADDISSGTRIYRNDDARWKAVISRDRAADGQFVYAVRSTGVYCRPTCPSRRPRRDHVIFFSIADQAERGGFRPCKRCQPSGGPLGDPWIEKIRRA